MAITERRAPKRAIDRRDNDEPISIKEHTERVEPILLVPEFDKLAPTQTKLRKDKPLPRWNKSRTDT
jgi:hypothetical protein